MTIARSALLTDLYQLTMLQTYHAERMHETAVFELFVRRLPPERNFLLAAGSGGYYFSNENIGRGGILL